MRTHSMRQQARIFQFFAFAFLVIEIISYFTIKPPAALAAPTNGVGTAPPPATSKKIAPSQSAQEIRVTLFGQPCLMRGPFEIPVLKAIHEISPEQIPPLPPMESPETISQLKKTLSKLNATSKIPSAFDRYRERLIRRVESQIAFAEGLRNARKNRKSAPLLESIKPYARQKALLKNFETLAKKLDEGRLADSQEYTRLLEQLGDLYGEMIETNPEEDFHTASRRLGIKYACSYEESAGDSGEEEETPSQEKASESQPSPSR